MGAFKVHRWRTGLRSVETFKLLQKVGNSYVYGKELGPHGVAVVVLPDTPKLVAHVSRGFNFGQVINDDLRSTVSRAGRDREKKTGLLTYHLEFLNGVFHTRLGHATAVGIPFCPRDGIFQAPDLGNNKRVRDIHFDPPSHLSPQIESGYTRQPTLAFILFSLVSQITMSAESAMDPRFVYRVFIGVILCPAFHHSLKPVLNAFSHIGQVAIRDAVLYLVFSFTP